MSSRERLVTSIAGRQIDEARITKFQAGLTGRLIRPSDADYETSRHIWNRAFDKRPAMIVRCADTSDVVGAVDFARTNDLLTAARGGGHSFSGKSTCDGGMVIDFSAMKSVAVDQSKLLAHADAGATLAEFDTATQSVGLATTMGTFQPTGIAGLTLGGGLGWLMGKYGLTCDNLVGAQLVTADGRLVEVAENHNADLLWGLRGGGGNFGVVTSFTYRLHPMKQVLAGVLKYAPTQLGPVLRLFRDYSSSAPDEVNMIAGILPLAEPAVGIAVAYCGEPGGGEKILEPLRSAISPVADTIKPLTYLQLQNMLDAPIGRELNLSNYSKNTFLTTLTDSAIDAMVNNVAQAPSPFCLFWLTDVHGAVCRVGFTDTACTLRNQGYTCETWSMWENPADADASTEWVRRFWASMQPFTDGRVYVNHLLDEDDRINSAYGANYQRLVQLKNKYDPDNFFRLNQNIKPAA